MQFFQHPFRLLQPPAYLLSDFFQPPPPLLITIPFYSGLESMYFRLNFHVVKSALKKVGKTENSLNSLPRHTCTTCKSCVVALPHDLRPKLPTAAPTFKQKFRPLFSNLKCRTTCLTSRK